MFLQLAHTKLDVFVTGKELVLSCYKISKLLPQEERFNMIQQLRRAALSIQLNIAEGSSRKSAIERRRFYEISRGSLIEVDTIFDVAVTLGYLKKEEPENRVLFVGCPPYGAHHSRLTSHHLRLWQNFLLLV
jgi:four helix bundle protein